MPRAGGTEFPVQSDFGGEGAVGADPVNGPRLQSTLQA
jgi:hypothetical protein